MSNGKQPKVKNEARDFRRFIEESFPVKEVGVASAREKSIRHGHISTLHIWWARRPLAASRATAYAALTPVPKDAEEWQKKRDFIIQLCQWENSDNQSLLERARREILEANGGVPPKVLDPFSGGGSYPLEALRLGCESYANDYNPVAVLIEKATLEYPLMFSQPFKGMPEWAKNQQLSDKSQGNKKISTNKNEEQQLDLLDASSLENPKSEITNPLLNAVHHWGNWVLEEARKELAEFYLPDSDGRIPIAYMWAHTIKCQNPSCGVEIPLIRQLWLSKKTKGSIALQLLSKNKKLSFKIIGEGYEKWPENFDADIGTVSRATVTCPICGSITDDKSIRQLFRQGQTKQKMIVAIFDNPHGSGKFYRIATSDDESLFAKVSAVLKQKQETLTLEWGLDAIPSEEILHTPSNTMGGTNRIINYGVKTWGQLFNERQKLTLLVFIEKIRQVHDQLTETNVPIEFTQAIMLYLGLAVDRLVDFGSILCVLNPTGGRGVVHTFGRQALSMVWDYAESNPFYIEAAGWPVACEKNEKWIRHAAKINSSAGIVSEGTATALHFPDEYFDAILTDPPYYDNVPYSYLSDFFYVWLKRSIGHVFPERFSTPLTTKKEEIVEYTESSKKEANAVKFFEERLSQAFKEMFRTLKTNGVATVVYAHKSTQGWESVINAIIDSGLTVTAAWPISTEMKGRLVASETAALASSIYIVARKTPRKSTGFYNDVRTELQQHLDAKLHRLWEEGIGGGDFFIAAIGSAIEVFGKYEQVMDFEGNIVRANRLLEEVRVIATNYAVKQILHDDFATEVSPIARFYVLWRWNYGEALVPFDEANKLAHSCGLDLSLQFSKNGFIKKEKQFARLLGPQGRKLDDLDDPRDMIDVLHKTLLLWERGLKPEMIKTLADRGFGRSEAFYRVAQAISETLPLESKEKKLLDGFLAGRDRVQDEVEKSAEQGKLL